MLSRSTFAMSALGLSLFAANEVSAQVCPNLVYAPTSIPVGDAPSCIAAGDLNGDGAQDLVVGRSPQLGLGDLVVWWGSGLGTFTARTILPGAWSPRSITIGDVNGDGFPDVVASDRGVLVGSGYTADGILVHLNDGGGGFTSLPMTLLDYGDDEPEGIRLGDVDRDGDLDAVVTIGTHRTGPLTTDSRVAVYANDGQGALRKLGSEVVGEGPTSLVLEDFDRDGALDVATMDGGANAVSVLHGQGDGTFAANLPPIGVGLEAAGLAAADFDLDGDVDLAVGWKYGVRALLNQGDGTFVNGHPQFFGYSNQMLVAGDFDLDGRPDLLATFASWGDAAFLHGDGTGMFAALRRFPVGVQACALATGDWNRDGIPDVVAGDPHGASLALWASECGTWTYCTAKTNSLGCVPSIGWFGAPSASWKGRFYVVATNVRNNENGMLLYTTGGRAAEPFHGGTLCLAGAIRRTPVSNSLGSLTGHDCSGSFSFDFNARIARGIDAALVPGAHVDAQFYMRDGGFRAPDNVGLTDAIEFTIEL